MTWYLYLSPNGHRYWSPVPPCYKDDVILATKESPVMPASTSVEQSATVP